MVGTIGDYARFAQMLLNGGTLGRQAVSQARDGRADDLGPYRTGDEDRARRLATFRPRTAGSVSALRCAPRSRSDAHLPIGEYRWDGVGGTFFFVDPRDDMFVICMMQTPSQRGRIEAAMKTLIYEALEN